MPFALCSLSSYVLRRTPNRLAGTPPVPPDYPYPMYALGAPLLKGIDSPWSEIAEHPPLHDWAVIGKVLCMDELVRLIISDRARQAAYARWKGMSVEDRKRALEPAHRARRKRKPLVRLAPLPELRAVR